MKSVGVVVGVALSIALSLFALTCTAKSPPPGSPSPSLPLRTLRDVPLTGGATRFDYQSFDPNTGRLYIDIWATVRWSYLTQTKKRRPETLKTCHGSMGYWPCLAHRCVNDAPTSKNVHFRMRGHAEKFMYSQHAVRVVSVH